MASGERRPGPLEYPEHFAKNARKMLKHFVEVAGSQRAAATRLGVSQTRISQLINGPEQPKLTLLIELRQQLQMPLDLILGLPPLAAEEEMGRKASRIHGLADTNLSVGEVRRSPRK